MSIVDVDAAAWRRVLDVNLKSMLFCCQAIVPAMIEARGGRIVKTGSTAAKVPRWEIGAYCVSKAAVHHFTRCLAMELAQYGITVNAVGPGATVTNLRQNSGGPEPVGSAEGRRQAQLKGDMSTSASACRSAGWARRRTRPMPSRSWPPKRPATSPASASTSTDCSHSARPLKKGPSASSGNGTGAPSAARSMHREGASRAAVGRSLASGSF